VKFFSSSSSVGTAAAAAARGGEENIIVVMQRDIHYSCGGDLSIEIVTMRRYTMRKGEKISQLSEMMMSFHLADVEKEASYGHHHTSSSPPQHSQY